MYFHAIRKVKTMNAEIRLIRRNIDKIKQRLDALETHSQELHKLLKKANNKRRINPST